jgi:hypothetical protein
MSALTAADARWLVNWLFRQSRQHQILSKRAKRAKSFAEAERLSDLSVKLWVCATALTKPTQTPRGD